MKNRLAKMREGFGLLAFEVVAITLATLLMVSESSGQCIPPASGVMSWWPGEGNANDIVGTNNGILQNGATYAVGKVGQAFSFDGVDDFVQASTTGLPTGNSNRTLELWVKIDAFVPAVEEAFFVGYGTFGGGGQVYALGASNGTLYFTQWGGAVFGPNLLTGQWYHVAVTTVGNSVSLYLNGAVVGTGSLGINTPAGTQLIMGKLDGNRRLQGKVDEVSIYGRALSASEILAIYSAGSDGKCKPPRITSFAPSSGPIGTTVTITGTGFSTTPTDNIVYFGATKATVTSATSTSLTVTVPGGATYKPISVAVNGKIAYSSKPFVVTFASGWPSDVVSFDSKVDFSIASKAGGVVLQDFDGDGKADVAVADTTNHIVSVFRNISTAGSIGTGSFATKVDFSTGGAPVSLVAGDFDADGKVDLAWAGGTGAFKVGALRNTSIPGTISFAAYSEYSCMWSPVRLSAGDIDGDGRIDLAGQAPDGGCVTVLRNTTASVGSIMFVHGINVMASEYSAESGSGGQTIADIDGDGRPEIIGLSQRWVYHVLIWRNLSTPGSFSFAAAPGYTFMPVNTGVPLDVTTGDVDGDGKTDVLVVNDNRLSVFRNTSSIGTLAFATKVDFATGTSTVRAALSDINGDGKPDVVVANNGSASVSVLRNTSTPGVINSGSFAAKVDFTVGTSPSGVEAGDIDGDGVPDITTSNYNANSSSVLRNKSQDQFMIAASATGAGNIVPAGQVIVNRWSTQSFTINANVGYHVADVLVDNVSVGAVSRYTFPNVMANHTIAASLAINTYTLEVTATNGIVTKNPDQPLYDHGSMVNVTATPSIGYHFVNWSGDVPAGRETDNPLTLTMDNNKTVTANFAINTYTLTVNAANGTAAKYPNLSVYNHGTTVQLTATPTTGYHFVNWTGDISSSANPLTLTMDGNKTIAANFAMNTYTLTVSATNGAVTKNPDQTVYDHGTTVELLAAAHTGFHFVNWTGDVPAGHETDNPLIVEMLSDKTLSANCVVTNKLPSANAGGPYSIQEGSPVTLAGIASDPDIGNTLTSSWSCTKGSNVDEGAMFTFSDCSSLTSTFTATDNGTYTLTLSVSDGIAPPVTSTTTVEVTNAVPQIDLITAPIDPLPVGTILNVSAIFTDAGMNDTHTGVCDWGNSNTTPATINQSTKSVTGSYSYATPGVYEVKVTVTDDDLGEGFGLFQYVVVYDPTAGFVTGGGWITSPPGAYVQDPTLTGRATFGFVSKYQRGAGVPTGNTEFQFRAASMNFKSTIYEWLVIAGARAQYKGSGTINGGGNYGFMLTAIDGQITGGGGTDKFRIKIWDRLNDGLVYDNQMGTPDNGDPTTVLGGGSIVIHRTGTAKPGSNELIPDVIALHQNSPNPFNPTTTIRYDLPQPAHVTLQVYDMLGKRVADLVNESKEAGYYEVTLNASNLASGMYIYRLTADKFTSTRKLVVLK